jgi:hypothetical protein
MERLGGRKEYFGGPTAAVGRFDAQTYNERSAPAGESRILV